MGFKSGTGKVLLVLFSWVFALGVTIAVLSPSWISFVSQQQNDGTFLEARYGPLYGQERTCGTVDLQDCSEWSFDTLQLDCLDNISGEGFSRSSNVCRLLSAWRVISMGLFVLLAVAGLFVCIGACCQAFTCGCCGGSMDIVVMILYWTEVVLSIVALVLVSEAVDAIEKLDTSIIDTGFGWGFWMFVLFGTIMGTACAIIAGWASENSLVAKVYGAITGIVKKILCCCS